MSKVKAIFSSLNECNTKKIFNGDCRSLIVARFGIVMLDDGDFNDVSCVQNISYNLISVYQITHSCEGKTLEFSPDQDEIKDLKCPKDVITIGIVDNIIRLYKFDKFGSSYFSSIFIAKRHDLSNI